MCDGVNDGKSVLKGDRNQGKIIELEIYLKGKKGERNSRFDDATPTEEGSKRHID